MTNPKGKELMDDKSRKVVNLVFLSIHATTIRFFIFLVLGSVESSSVIFALSLVTAFLLLNAVQWILSKLKASKESYFQHWVGSNLTIGLLPVLSVLAAVSFPYNLFVLGFYTTELLRSALGVTVIKITGRFLDFLESLVKKVIKGPSDKTNEQDSDSEHFYRTRPKR